MQAAIDLDSAESAALPPHIAGHIAGIRPAVRLSASRDPEAVGKVHLEQTVKALVERSELISDAIAACTAPHASCASTMMSGTSSTATAYSSDAMAESEIT